MVLVISCTTNLSSLHVAKLDFPSRLSLGILIYRREQASDGLVHPKRPSKTHKDFTIVCSYILRTMIGCDIVKSCNCDGYLKAIELSVPVKFKMAAARVCERQI